MQSFNDYSPLYALAEKHGFKMGAVYSPWSMKSEEYLSFLKAHFNSVTCANETKAYSLLDQQASMANPDGMPVMNYALADRMLSWARENNIRVRGHVLVWDAYMTDWYFREGYDSSKPYADRETMRLRTRYYIDQVVTHFEEKFPGTIYCWDVVNEAIGDHADEWDGSDARHIRTIRGGVDNLFKTHLGNDYVEFSFLCAKDTVEKLGADIKLIYNDYNMYYPWKRDAALELVHSINHYAKDASGAFRKLCDGVGMQGYIGGYGTQSGCMKESNLTDIKKSILKYHDELGLEVQITEMAVRNYKPELEAEQAAFYQKLFKVFKSINRDQEEPILTNVAIWGLCDRPNEPSTSYGYKMNGTHGGLFGARCTVKEAFLKVHEELAAD